MKCHKKTIAVQWHITDKCQMKCKHCYIGDKYPVREMTKVQIKNILDDLLKYAKKEDYCFEFYLTGGDPLLHEHYIEVLEMFSQRQLEYSIMCNPISINSQTLEVLKKYQVKMVQMSIDGMKEHHEFIRGKESFDNLIDAVKKVNDADIKTALMFTLYDFNADDLFDVMSLANRMDVNRFSFDLGISIGRAKTNQLKMIEPKRLSEILLKYIKIKENIKAQGTSIE